MIFSENTLPFLSPYIKNSSDSIRDFIFYLLLYELLLCPCFEHKGGPREVHF